MNSHDKAITDELQINSFIDRKIVSANLLNTKAPVINLSVYSSKKRVNESENESSLFDELDYGNYE
jgi:hypothetical protein